MKSIKMTKPVDFIEEYITCCKEFNTKPKVHLAKNECLIISADKLDLTDWTPLLKALGSNHTLHSLKILSTYYTGAKLSKNGNQMVVEPVFFNPKVLNNLTQTVGNMMTDSALLSSLILDGIPLSNEAISILGKGIQDCTNLQHLALPNCMIGDFGAYCLCHLVTTHTGLKLLDMSNCKLTTEGAKHISSMIRTQKLACFGELWKQSLRYRTPDVDIFPGLRRITLNNNGQIRDIGFKMILHELLDDQWIKAIDAQNCGITIDSKPEILDVLKTNPVIAVLDVQRNDVPIELTETIKKVLKIGNSAMDKTYDWLSNTPSILSQKANTSTMCKKSASNIKPKATNDPKSFLSLNSRNVHFSSNNLRNTFTKQTNTKAVTELTKSKNLKPSNSMFVKKISREHTEKKNSYQCGSYVSHAKTNKTSTKNVPYTANSNSSQKLRRENKAKQPKLTKSATSMPVKMDHSNLKKNTTKGNVNRENKTSKMSVRSECVKKSKAAQKMKIASPYCVTYLGFTVPQKPLKEHKPLVSKGSHVASSLKTKKRTKKPKSNRKSK